MPRLLTRLLPATLLLSTQLLAGFLPDSFAGKERGASGKPAVADQALWAEYGYQDGETATYGDAKVTAWRMQDPTGALAAFDVLRPADSTPSTLGKFAVETATGAVLIHGNYVLQFEGVVPKTQDVAPLIGNLPKLDQSGLPSLLQYMPRDGQKPNSNRYVLGPVSLRAFAPAIPAATAAFNIGAEAEVASFPAGTLAVFYYPTPQFAMERLKEFEKLPGALTKRSGPLVAILLSPAEPETAQQLLSKVKYQAEITWSERMPTRRDNIGDLVINAFELIGLLLIFATVAGVSFGGFRVLRRKTRKGDDPEALTTLHLQG